MRYDVMCVGGELTVEDVVVGFGDVLLPSPLSSACVGRSGK